MLPDLRDIIPVGHKDRDYPRYRVTNCHLHKDENPSMLVFADGYNCRGCGAYGSTWKYLQENDLHASDYTQESRYTRPESSTDPVISVDCGPLDISIAEVLQTNITDEHIAWLASRGISDGMARRWKIGASFNGEEITIPIIMDQQCWNIKRRLINARKNKYRSWVQDDCTYGKNRLFNADSLVGAGECIITEGEFDCIVTQEFSDIPCVTPTTGSGSWDASWNQRFTHISSIYIIPDRDRAGLSGALRIASILGQRRSYVVPLPSRLGEKGDLTDFWLHRGSRLEFICWLSRAIPALQCDERSDIWREYIGTEDETV